MSVRRDPCAPVDLVDIDLQIVACDVLAPAFDTLDADRVTFADGVQTWLNPSRRDLFDLLLDRP